MSEKRTTKLFDYTKARQGTYVEKVLQDEKGRTIQPDPNAKVDNVCKVKFYEEIDIKKSPIRWIKALFGRVDPKVTDQKFPVQAVYTRTLDATAAGQPREVCVIEEDQFGNSSFFEGTDKKHEKKISSLQRRAEESDWESNKKELETIGQEEDDNKDSTYKRGRGRRPSPGAEPLGEYQDERGDTY